MEKLELFFLRSFEKEIAKEILYYAARLDESGQTLEDVPQIHKYIDHYGIYKSDIGVYALYDNTIAGAAWVRILSGDNKGFGYIDDQTPELVFGVKPPFRNQGIGSKILEQLIYEVSLSYTQMSLAVREGNPVISLYERFGFIKVEGSEKYDPKRDLYTFTMIKQLEMPKVDNHNKEWFEATQKWRMPQ